MTSLKFSPKLLTVLIVAVLMVIGNGLVPRQVYATTPISVTGCQALTSSGSTYTLTNSIVQASSINGGFGNEFTCILIAAPNITFNLNGFNITDTRQTGDDCCPIQINSVNDTVTGPGTLRGTYTLVSIAPLAGTEVPNSYCHNTGGPIVCSQNATIRGVTLHGNSDTGIDFSDSICGTLSCQQFISNGDFILGNTISSIGGIGIDLYNGGFCCTSSITIANNIITHNGIGVRIPFSGNLIYNNFFNNTVNAQSSSLLSGTNSWNITKTPGTNIVGGPFLGGNFWSNYNGTDTDNDGIGDTMVPYNVNIPVGGDYLPLVASSSAQKCQACPPGLVNWWPANGNANDIVGGNNGALINGASFASGEVGQAFNLTGANQYVQAQTAVPFGSNDFSIDFWTNFNSIPGGCNTGRGCLPSDIFIGDDNGAGCPDKWFFGLGGGVLSFVVSGSACLPEAFFAQYAFTPNLHQWYNLAVTRNAGNITIYINGLKVSSELTVATSSPTAPLTIGAAEGAGFNGFIDEVQIYNNALPPSGIQAIHNAGGAGLCPCAPRPTGLVGWWPAEGNANDIAGSHNGALVNGATFGPGEVGQAFSFNGINQSVNVSVSGPSSLDLTSAVTLGAWIRLNSLSCTNGGGSVFCAVVAKSDYAANTRNYGLWVRGDGGLEVAYKTVGSSPQNDVTAFTAPNSIIPGTFYFVAATINPSIGQIKLYVNGVEQGVTIVGNPTSQLVSNQASVTIGSSDPGFGFFFNGLVDEVQIYNRALTASEVASIYSAGGVGVCRCTPSPSGLEGWWPGEGNANDVTGANNGTLINGASFGPGVVGQAFSFSSTGQYVDFGNSPGLQVSRGSFSVEAWVKFNSISGDMVIFSKMNPAAGVNGDGWALIKQFDNLFWFCLGETGNGCVYGTASTVTSTTSATPGVWYHVAAVKSPTSISIYVNGTLEGTKPTPAFIDTNSTDLVLNSATGSTLFGLIDEAQIFDTALNASDIQAIFSAGSFGQCGHAGHGQVSPFDFTVSASPSDETVLAGGMARYQLTLTPVSGTPQPVTLSIASGLPSGSTALFTTNAVTPSGFSNLTITTTGGALGDFNITVDASGPSSHTLTVRLHVYDFTVDSSLCRQTVLRGAIAPFNLTFTLLPGSSIMNLPPIQIDAIGLPLNTTVVITSPPGGATIQSVTLSTTPVIVEVLFVTHANTPLGDFGFGISLIDNRTPEGGSRQISDCVGGFQIHTFNFTVGFSCAVSVTGTTSGSVNVTLTPGSSTVNLPPISIQYSGLPTGSLVQNQSGFPPFTVPCGFAIPHNFTGTFSLGVSGIFRPGSVGGFGVGAAPPGGQPGQFLVLHIYDFQVIVVPSETVLRGGTGNYTATIQLLGGSSVVNLPNIYLNVSGLPSGVLARFDPNNGTALGFTSILTLQISASTPLGDFMFNVTGCDIRPLLGGCRVGTGTLHIYDFVITSSPTSSTVNVGGSAVFNETLTLLTGSSTIGLPEIHLSTLGLPAGSFVTLSSTEVVPAFAGNSTTLTITPNSAGTFNLAIIGKDSRTPEGRSRSSLPLSPQTLNVLMLSPTVTTAITPTTITANSVTLVYDNATLSGGYHPTGTLKFRVYFNSPTCAANNLVFTSTPIPVSGNGNYMSTPGFTTGTAGSYYWTSSYSGDSNNNPLATSCGASGETLLVTANLSQITDSSFCPIANNQFTINYRSLGYELVSTNPGQFYDNVFYTGTPGTQATLVIGIPFPFVTQGSTPIQVSSSYQTSGGCFQPSFDATGQFSIIATGGSLSSSHSPILILGNYGTLQVGSYVYVTVSGTVPSTGLIYVTIHLNYGLRTQSFYRITSGTGSGTGSGIQCTPTSPCAQWTANPAVIICSQEPYIFTVSGALTVSYQTKSVNNFPTTTTHYVIV